MVGVNLPHGRRRHRDRRWQSGRRCRRCRGRDACGRNKRSRRQSSLLRRWASRRRWQCRLLRHRTNSRRRYGLRLHFGGTRIRRLWRGRRGFGLASHKRLPDCVEPLSVGDGQDPAWPAPKQPEQPRQGLDRDLGRVDGRLDLLPAASQSPAAVALACERPPSAARFQSVALSARLGPEPQPVRPFSRRQAAT